MKKEILNFPLLIRDNYMYIANQDPNITPGTILSYRPEKDKAPVSHENWPLFADKMVKLWNDNLEKQKHRAIYDRVKNVNDQLIEQGYNFDFIINFWDSCFKKGGIKGGLKL